VPNPAFPNPACSPEPFDSAAIDNTIRSKKEAGYVQARPRFTRKQHNFGPIAYSLLLPAEWQAIKAHDDTVGGWGMFSWIHPEWGSTHQVRYGENGRPKFQRVGTGGLMQCTFSLEEV
jgi:hypothetical protein